MFKSYLKIVLDIVSAIPIAILIIVCVCVSAWWIKQNMVVYGIVGIIVTLFIIFPTLLVIQERLWDWLDW